MSNFETAEELAERLRLRPDTIRLWTRQGIIPAIRVTGKVIRYDPAEVERREVRECGGRAVATHARTLAVRRLCTVPRPATLRDPRALRHPSARGAVKYAPTACHDAGDRRYGRPDLLTYSVQPPADRGVCVEAAGKRNQLPAEYVPTSSTNSPSSTNTSAPCS